MSSFPFIFIANFNKNIRKFLGKAYTKQNENISS